MDKLQADVNRAVGAFVTTITDLARRAALDSLDHALGQSGRRGAIGSGAKRTPAALEAMGAKFRDYVAKHPGLRIEQINKELGTSTKALALPIRKMIADGTIKTKGAKRTTTYFPGK